MQHETKEIIVNYGVIGSFVSVFATIIRPYVSIKNTLRDSSIILSFAIVSGLLLENWADTLNESVRTGLSALVSFYAVRLYEISIVVLGKVKENPNIIIDKVKK